MDFLILGTDKNMETFELTRILVKENGEFEKRDVRLKRPKEFIINSINRGRNFYTLNENTLTPVELFDNRYIRSSPNNTENDNLKNLPLIK